MSDDADEDRPDAIRVARRAMVLYAVASRGSFERAAPQESGEAYRSALLDWVADRDLDGELEPAERALLDTPVGEAAERAFVNAWWRPEGAAVLAWALGRLGLPAIDRQAGLPAVGDAVYELPPVADLRLRDAGPITDYEALLYHLNWRVVHHRLDPAPYDVRAGDAESPLPDVTPIAYAADGDLAVDGVSFTDAPPDRRAACTSIIIERRRAASWLCGDDPVYSQVSMGT